MFVRINLLESKRSLDGGAARRFRLALPDGVSQSTVRATVIGCLVVAVFVGSRGVHLHLRHTKLADAIDAAVADSTLFARELERFGAVAASQESITARIRVAREIDGRRYVWAHLLDELSATLPDQAWLVEIMSILPPDSAGDVAFAIQGRAGSATAISEYIRELERSPFVEGVSFIHAVQESMNDRTVHRFGLEARYEVPDSAAIQVARLEGETR
jgi:Tfp pilus assembly protein PilN